MQAIMQGAAASEAIDPKRAGQQQAHFRVFVVGSVLIISAATAFYDRGRLAGAPAPHVTACILYLCFSISLLIAYRLLEKCRGTSFIGRAQSALITITLCSDAVAIGLYGSLSGASVVAIAPIAITYVIGNGFRFGPKHFIAAQAIMCACFFFVFARNPVVGSYPLAAASYFAALCFIPAYALILLRRYKDLVLQLNEVSMQRENLLKLLSHEIRSPVFNLAVIAETIGDQVTNGPITETTRCMLRQNAETISSICSEITNLCDSTLENLISPERDSLPRFRHPENLYSLIQTIVTDYKETAIRRGIEIRWHIHAATEPYIALTSGYLRAAIGNLIENEIKHGRWQVIRLGVEADCSKEGDDYLVFTVESTAGEHGDATKQRPVPSDLLNTRSYGVGKTALETEVAHLGGVIVGSLALPESTRFSFRVPFLTITDFPRAHSVWGYCRRCGTVPNSHELRKWSEAGYLLRWKSSPQGFEELSDKASPDCIATTTLASLQYLQGGDNVGSVRFSASEPVFMLVNQRGPADARQTSYLANYMVDDESVGLTRRLSAFRRLRPLLTSPVSLQGISVLIVDDSMLITTHVAQILEYAGATAFQANDVRHALEALDQHLFDCLIVDNNVGSENGRDAASYYRQHSRGAGRVLLLTGMPRGDVNDSFFDTVISKADPPGNLVAAVAHACGRMVGSVQGETSATATCRFEPSESSEGRDREEERYLVEILYELNTLLLVIEQCPSTSKLSQQMHRFQGVVEVVVGPRAEQELSAMREQLDQKQEIDLEIVRQLELAVRVALRSLA